MDSANIGLGINEIIVMMVVLAATAWSLVWKGIALWHAARNGQKGWFVALLVFQTLGLLEILYLVAFRPKTPPASVTSS